MLRKRTEELAYSSIIWRRYQEVMEIWGTSKSISQLRHTWEVSGYNWIWRMTSIEFNVYQEVTEIRNTLKLIFQLRHIWQGSTIRYRENMIHTCDGYCAVYICVPHTSNLNKPMLQHELTYQAQHIVKSYRWSFQLLHCTVYLENTSTKANIFPSKWVYIKEDP